MSRISKRRSSWLLASALFTGLALCPISTRVAMAAHDHNPRIHAAVDALRDARHELEDAPHDFHGHKQEAIDAIDHAITQLDRIKDW